MQQGSNNEGVGSQEGFEDDEDAPEVFPNEEFPPSSSPIPKFEKTFSSSWFASSDAQPKNNEEASRKMFWEEDLLPPPFPPFPFDENNWGDDDLSRDSSKWVLGHSPPTIAPLRLTLQQQREDNVHDEHPSLEPTTAPGAVRVYQSGARTT